MKNLSFRELSALGSALILALVAWLYLPDAFHIAGAMDVREMTADGWREFAKSNSVARLGIGALVLLIVLQIIYHAVIGAALRQESEEPMDERDRLVALKADRAGYHALYLGALGLVVALFAWGFTGLQAALALLTALIFADVVHYLAAFLYYRKSI